jgi:hypothetical protein
MALEALAWPAEPAVTDAVDDVQAYNMGIQFTVPEAVPCAGVQWRVPDALSTPPEGAYQASVWRVGDEAKLAAANFVPVAGGYQDVLFETPVTLVTGQSYVAAVYTTHYVYRASGGIWPSTPSGSAVADEGRLRNYNGGPNNVAAFPGSPTGLLFYVSPLVGTDEGEDPDRFTSGRATTVLTATGTRSTTRALTGAGALALGAAAARSTARTTAGSAGLGAAARASRASNRSTSGSARLVLAALGAQVRGGGGPRLVTSTRVGALTSASRPGVIITSTRG